MMPPSKNSHTHKQSCAHTHTHFRHASGDTILCYYTTQKRLSKLLFFPLYSTYFKVFYEYHHVILNMCLDTD